MSSVQVSTPAIRAENVSVGFLLRYHRSEVTLRETFVRQLDRFSWRGDREGRWSQRFWALRNITLDVHPGEVLGLVGRNGSGKSSLLKTLAGILEPDEGHVAVQGKVGCLMSFGVGFKPNLSGRENAYINGSILGLSEREVDQRIQDIIDFADLGDFIDAPVRTYSSGMKGRLGFAIAVHINPDVLLLDEVLSVGDAAFREKAGSILDRMREEQKTIVIASHSIKLLQEQCTRVVWLDKGQIRMSGTADEVTAAYVEQTQTNKKRAAATD